jgi:hypothetical protein
LLRKAQVLSQEHHPNDEKPYAQPRDCHEAYAPTSIEASSCKWFLAPFASPNT